MKNHFYIFLVSTLFVYKIQAQAIDFYAKGREEFLTGNYSLGLENLLKATSTSKAKDLNYLIAMSCFNLKKYPDAIVYFTKDIQENKNNLNSYIKRAQSKKQIGHYKSALKDLDDLLKIDNTYFLAWYEKGDLRFGAKKYKQAIDDYNKALALKPGLEKAYHKLGFCYLNLKDTVQACNNWRKIEDLDDFEGYQKIEELLTLKSK